MSLFIDHSSSSMKFGIHGADVQSRGPRAAGVGPHGWRGGVALTGLEVLQRLVTLARVADAGVRGTIRGPAGLVGAVDRLAGPPPQDGPEGLHDDCGLSR